MKKRLKKQLLVSSFVFLILLAINSFGMGFELIESKFSAFINGFIYCFWAIFILVFVLEDSVGVDK